MNSRNIKFLSLFLSLISTTLFSGVNFNTRTLETYANYYQFIRKNTGYSVQAVRGGRASRVTKNYTGEQLKPIVEAFQDIISQVKGTSFTVSNSGVMPPRRLLRNRVMPQKAHRGLASQMTSVVRAYQSALNRGMLSSDDIQGYNSNIAPAMNLINQNLFTGVGNIDLNPTKARMASGRSVSVSDSQKNTAQVRRLTQGIAILERRIKQMPNTRRNRRKIATMNRDLRQKRAKLAKLKS